MKTKLMAVLDSPRWQCPHCSSDQDFVQAIKNGFVIADNGLRFSTDLVHCLNCGEIYVVMPPDAYKRRPKKRAEFPKLVEVELTEWHTSEHLRLLEQWAETQKRFALLAQ